MPNLYNSLMERLEGRQYSNYFACFCPFDKHESPALLVFDDGLAKCLSCNRVWTHKVLDKKIGSHFRPTQHLDTVSRVLPRWRNWEQKYGDLEGIVTEAQLTLKRFPQFQTYFKKRKIYEFTNEGRLGYLDGWAMFPVILRDSKIVDIVVRSVSRNSDVRYVVSPTDCGHSELYVPSWRKVDESETCYVVYGIIDAISLHLVGLPVVTGISGKSLSPDLLKPIRKKFVILPDAGEEREAHKLANSLGWRARVKELEYEEGCKDPDDIRKTFGNDYLLQAIGA